MTDNKIKGNLVILAGGMSSRMKNSIAVNSNISKSHYKQVKQKAKCMIEVGKTKRPFMDYLLYNAFLAGYSNIIFVVNMLDTSIKEYYTKSFQNSFLAELKFSFITQTIPKGREKPLGTADALFQALKGSSYLNGQKVAVCNSDNLYSTKAFLILKNSHYKNTMIDYNRESLKFDTERIKKFAINLKNKDGFLQDIIEKPSEELYQQIKNSTGVVGVSMNIYNFDYDFVLQYLKITPINKKRDEKELPTTLKLMIKDDKKAIFTIPLSEHVPDLTSVSDIEIMENYLNNFSKNQEA